MIKKSNVEVFGNIEKVIGNIGIIGSIVRYELQRLKLPYLLKINKLGGSTSPFNYFRHDLFMGKMPEAKFVK